MEKNTTAGWKELLLVLCIVAILAIADQWSKGLIETRMTLHQSVNVLPGFFDIVYIRNRGAAFGIMAGVDSVWVGRGFTIFTLFALAALAGLYRGFPPGERLGRAAITMIASGAVGNLWDRLEHGSVTDFLLFYIGKYQWPAFNLADSLITTGVVLLAYSLIFHMPPEEPQTPAEAGDQA